MPPRLFLLRAPRLRPSNPSTPTCAFLIPVAHTTNPSTSSPPTTSLYPHTQHQQQRRSASILSSISDVPSAYQKRIRLGRGPASGKGKTSGRGHKGQKQHGKVPRGFNGGQTKDDIVTPVRGVGNRVSEHFGVDLAKVNVDRIQEWIDQGRIDPKQPITLVELHRTRVTHGIKDGVKLLARNKEALRTPINIIVSRASQQAIEAVERCGGTVTTRYYTNASIRRILKGETDPIHSMMSNFPNSPYILPTTPLDAETSSAAADAQPSPVENPTTYELPSSTSAPPTSSSSSEIAPSLFSAMSLQKKKFPYRLPDAHSRRDLEYYRDPAHRGYLSHMVKAHEGPSLFFKPPKTKEESMKLRREGLKRKASKGKGMEDRLW